MQHSATTGEKMRDRIQKKHNRAVELRYAGKTYEEIAAILTEEFPGKVSLTQSVRRWFMSGGRLEQEYTDYARKENERRRAFTMEEMKKLVEKIPVAYDIMLNNALKEAQSGAINDDLRKLLKDLAEIMGLSVPPGSAETEDPVARYFRLKREQIKQENGE